MKKTFLAMALSALAGVACGRSGGAHGELFAGNTAQQKSPESGWQETLSRPGIRQADGSLCPSDQDEIYGTCIPKKQGFTVVQGEIYRQGELVQLKGINWFGLDTGKHSLHGLWTGRSLESYLRQVKELGFNALRIPVAPEALQETTVGDDGYAHPLDEIKALLQLAEQLHLFILFDIHNCSADAGYTTGTPTFCPNYGVDAWKRDLKTLAELTKTSTYTVGIDLYNEPYKLSWDDWHSMAEDAARVVLTSNPSLLVFVEGVGDLSSSGQHATFWGENLYPFKSKPLNIPRSRLVLSPHTYGPSVYAEHVYFKDQSFPNNMPGVWDEHFGFLRDLGYPVAVGEFGGRLQGKDAEWQIAFISYLRQRNIRHFFYWSLNPDSGDTGGILLDDWQSVDTAKMQALQQILQN